jgi:hypothetical protein
MLTVPLYQVPRNGKSETQSAHGGCGAGFSPYVCIEEALKHFGPNTDTGVAYTDEDPAGFALDSQADLTAIGSKFCCVDQQIREDLSQPPDITLKNGGIRGQDDS